ncbi:MAG: Phosphoribosylformylglycinamidine synthase [Desulfonauticus sp. 38_4375]|nr:MAG: Phosphoribosylformylglycinamidine synthase [Desulfonauticus sp. 38_4375]
MAKVKVLVITGFGTNCERESAYAARQAGADKVDICFFSDLIQEKVFLKDYNFLVFPGGFLDGDDLGGAQAAAIRWKYAKTISGTSLRQELENFLKENKIILGICNGFQLLTKLGLLPALENNYFERQVSLSYNDSARFEDRWVWLKVNTSSPCIFTKNLDYLYLPVRHGEGKVIPFSSQILTQLEENNLIALQYISPQNKQPTLEYPYNPNGSPLGIAGLTDPSGRILGLMPHPEAYNHPTNHPKWTRGVTSPLGTLIFANGVEYLRQ